LKVYNTLTRKVEDFKPLAEGKAGIYVCGPTVYGHAHLGHAKSYVSFDILVRYLRYLGYAVTYVQNITDVGHLTDDADEGEDKLVVAAKKEKKHPMALAEYYTRSYFEDMDKLHCVRPDISPRASGHIPEQIELVKKLLEKGYAYEVNGSVYFDVSKFSDYGKLSGRNVEDMQAGARVEVSPDKKHPADFALWKKAEPNHIMQWLSPWGNGFPGWHLECSVMSMKYLGKTIDIHGGGKMGKSLNNFILLKELFSGSHELLSRKYDPLAVRQLILQSHYRSPIDFSDAALTAAQSGFDRISDAVIALRNRMGQAPDGEADKVVLGELEELTGTFEEAMNNDMNTSVGLSVMFDLVRLANRLFEKKDATGQTLKAVDEKFSILGGAVLGIVKDEYPQTGFPDNKPLEDIIDKFNLFVEIRELLRRKKQFKASDDIRNYLGTAAIEIEDSPDGSQLKGLDDFLKRYRNLKIHGNKKEAEKYSKSIIEYFKNALGVE